MSRSGHMGTDLRLLGLSLSLDKNLSNRARGRSLGEDRGNVFSVKWLSSGAVPSTLDSFVPANGRHDDESHGSLDEDLYL